MRRARPGSPVVIPRARDQNRLYDAAEPGPPIDPEPGPGQLLVQNDTGTDLEAWSVVGLDSPLVDFDTDEHIFRTQDSWSGIDVDKRLHWNRFAILHQGCADGAIVSATSRGIVRVEVDITNEFHTHAMPKNGVETELESTFGGCPILWKPPGETGLQWCVVELRPDVGHHVIGFLVSLSAPEFADDVLAPTTGSLAVYLDEFPVPEDPPPQLTDTVGTVPLRNWDETLEAGADTFGAAMWGAGDLWTTIWTGCSPSQFPGA